MTDYQLLEKMVLSFVDEPAKIPISNVFANFKSNPVETTVEGVSDLKSFISHPDVMVRSAAINGMMVGMFMAKISENATSFIFTNYLEETARIRGQNVYCFLEEKAKRR